MKIHQYFLIIFLFSVGMMACEEKTTGSGNTDNAAYVSENQFPSTPHLQIEAHEGAVNTIAFSPDGSLLVSAGVDGTVRSWNPLTGEPIGSFEENLGVVNALAFNSDGTRLASAGNLPGIPLLVWDTASGEELGRANLEEQDLALSMMISQGEPINMFAVAFVSEDSVFAGGEMGTLFAWESGGESGMIGRSINVNDPVLMSLSVSPDDQFLVWARSDGLAYTRTDDPNDTRNVLEGHTDVVSSTAFAPSGKMIVSGSWDDTVRLWDISDAANPQSIAVLEGHTGDVTRVAFHPDSTFIISGSRDGTLRLWDTSTNESVATFSAGEGLEINDVAFSPDGTHIASAASNGIIYIWALPGDE